MSDTVPVKTPDVAHIINPSTDGYGDVSVTTENEIACAFFQQFNQQEATNQDLIQSDAYAYLDVDNDFIKGVGYKLQGMYFKTTAFGVEQWYRITAVQIAQRKLLTNEVNNVMVNLEIIASPSGVS